MILLATETQMPGAGVGTHSSNATAVGRVQFVIVTMRQLPFFFFGSAAAGTHTRANPTIVKIRINAPRRLMLLCSLESK